MAKKVIKATFQLRRGYSDTYAQQGDIVLAAGEPAFELDTGRLKIGDGETPWRDLPYIYDKEFVYKPGGSIDNLEDLPALDDDSNIGYVYNIKEGFITTGNFIEGEGKYYSAGTDVAIIKTSEGLKYNIYGGFVDLSDYATKGYVDAKELTAGDGIVIESQAVGLLPKYNDYLVRATFEIPKLTLTMSDVNGTNVNGAKEIGTSLTISTIGHSETNKDNIADGTLKFYRAGTARQSVTPSASGETVMLDEAITEAGTSAGSVSYKLQCTDTLTPGNTRSSNIITATWYRYVYSQVGNPEIPPESATNCVKQADLKTFAENGAKFNYTVGKCIWLLTTNPNAVIQQNIMGDTWSNVTTYGGESVTFTQENNATATYYAYRTDAFIGEGTATYRITNPS